MEQNGLEEGGGSPAGRMEGRECPGAPGARRRWWRGGRRSHRRRASRGTRRPAAPRLRRRVSLHSRRGTPVSIRGRDSAGLGPLAGRDSPLAASTATATTTVSPAASRTGGSSTTVSPCRWRELKRGVTLGPSGSLSPESRGANGGRGGGAEWGGVPRREWARRLTPAASAASAPSMRTRTRAPPFAGRDSPRQSQLHSVRPSIRGRDSPASRGARSSASSPYRAATPTAFGRVRRVPRRKWKRRQGTAQPGRGLRRGGYARRVSPGVPRREWEGMEGGAMSPAPGMEGGVPPREWKGREEGGGGKSPAPGIEAPGSPSPAPAGAARPARRTWRRGVKAWGLRSARQSWSPFAARDSSASVPFPAGLGGPRPLLSRRGTP